MKEERIKNEYDPSNLSNSSVPVVELRDVVKKFGKKTVLDSVTYALEPGSVFALLGENGAGKTTTIRMILGETLPTSGQINVFGLNPSKFVSEIRSRVGFVPETPSLYTYMTVRQLGKFASAFYPQGYMAEYARRCEEFGLAPDVKIKSLSKGMKAKASLALALSHDPDLLVLDEPTSGLDALVRRQFLENIADLAAAGKTVFLSSHQTAEVERVADRVAFLKDSKIVLNEKLDDLKATTQTIVLTIVGENALDDSFAALFASLFNGPVVDVERYGARFRVLGRNVADNFDERLKSALGERLKEASVERPSLEEIFVAYMSERK